jgi:hypothetical protein
MSAPRPDEASFSLFCAWESLRWPPKKKKIYESVLCYFIIIVDRSCHLFSCGTPSDKTFAHGQGAAYWAEVPGNVSNRTFPVSGKIT